MQKGLRGRMLVKSGASETNLGVLYAPASVIFDTMAKEKVDFALCYDLRCLRTALTK